MIDWVTLMVDVPNLPDFGKRTTSDEFGVIEKVTTIPKNVKSSSTSIFVLPWDKGLLISGNPSKFIQGHNVFAIDDWAIVEEMVKRVVNELTGCWYYSIKKMTRIDINYGLVFNNHHEIEMTLAALANTTGDKWGRPVCKMGSVYFGNRKRQLLKLYAKAPEFSRNMKNTEYSDLELLPILRPELTVGRNHFEEHDWKQYKSAEFRKSEWNKNMKRIRINELETFDASILPKKNMKIYALWLSGVDLKSMYSQGTIYNYASEMRSYGIDIYQKPEKSNILNLARTLESRSLTAQDCIEMGLPVWTQSAA